MNYLKIALIILLLSFSTEAVSHRMLFQWRLSQTNNTPHLTSEGRRKPNQEIGCRQSILEEYARSNSDRM
jgi:hypothetical protein